MEQRVIGLSQDIIHLQEMQMLLSKSTENRRAIYEKLSQKQWFAKTDPELRKKLLSLPDRGRENHDGFLEDLANRPEEISNIKVERMVDLPHGSFALIPKFEVSRKDNPGMHYTYEYVSWRTGPESGGKGVVFVENDKGEPTHFILMRGGKFATAKQQLDAVGGFSDNSSFDEINNELGLQNLEIKRITELGRVLPDSGMTNNEPSLFAAFISDKDMGRIPKEPVNPDIYEIKGGAVVFPIDQLPRVVMTNTDGYFLSTVARAWAKGVIPFPHTLTGKSVGLSNS